MHLARTRSLFFLAFLTCALIAGATVYLGRLVAFAPCPLCFLQRALLLSFAMICLVASLHAPGEAGWRLYASVLFLIALVGAVAAARQVWLQASPPENIASCLENLQYLLDTQPYLKVLWMVFVGSAGCSEITWSLFGISMPEWSLLAFAGLSLFAAYYLFIEFRRSGSMDTGGAD